MKFRKKKIFFEVRVKFHYFHILSNKIDKMMNQILLFLQIKGLIPIKKGV